MNELTAFIIENGGAWGEHPDHTLKDWQLEVQNNDTRLAYWEWAFNQEEIEK